jgi:hypothetical protein
MTTHTPGPWELDDELCVYATSGRPAKEVARVIGWTLEDIANASLIVAAPDMLAALRAALLVIGGTAGYRDGQPSVLNAAHLTRTAIAKAEGKP